MALYKFDSATSSAIQICIWEPLFCIYLHDDNEPTAASSLHDSMPDLGSARSNIRRPLNSTRGMRRAIKKSDDNEPTAASSLHDSMPSLGSRTRSIARSRSAGSTIRRPLSTPRVSHCAITNSDDNEPTAASSCMYLFLLVLFGTSLFCVLAYNKTIHKFASGLTVTRRLILLWPTLLRFSDIVLYFSNVLTGITFCEPVTLIVSCCIRYLFCCGSLPTRDLGRLVSSSCCFACSF
jgi:hypothetical protein